MSFNRLMMRQNVDLKNIKAMMTVGSLIKSYGFDGTYSKPMGSLSPNPLPNGVLVTICYANRGYFNLRPSSIKSCTINNITLRDDERNDALYSYLKQNVGKTIPVIFHFD